MPAVDVGDVVYWFADADAKNEPCVAFVTHVGEETVALTVLIRDCPAVGTRDGVRHVADPKLRFLDDRSSGAWDHTPLWKLLRNLRDVECKKS